MANKDAAFGLIPARMMGGAPYSGGQSRYRIASNQSGAIFQGDLVKQLTGGTVSRAAASSTVPVVGVFNGVQYTDPTSKEVVFKNHYPGSIVASDIIAFIIDDPTHNFTHVIVCTRSCVIFSCILHQCPLSKVAGISNKWL